jgi:RHS repeat-associated protein
VEYGTDQTYGHSTALDPALVTAHSQGLSGLTPGMQYHYRVKSRDATGNLAFSDDFTFTTNTLDTSAPVISNVTAGGVTATTATITWTTNENSDCQVEYGTTQAYGHSTALNPALVTTHSQGLSGLTSETLYHYRVKSKDAAGNLAFSDDFTFTTADVTAPVISNVAAGVTTTTATITWTTNENSDSQVMYGTTTDYGQSTTLNPTLVTAHSRGLSGLAPGTQYHYRVKSRDAAGNLAVSDNFTFTTAQNGSATLKWLVTDHLGSTRMVIDETGSLAGITLHDFLPFGEELGTGVGIRSAALGYGDDSIRQKFGSKERDNETRLDYFIARYHSSVQGRFTSVDPENAGSDPEDPQSWNGYAYTRNNPVLYSDPDGRRYWVCGPNGGGSCSSVSDLEFNLDRDALERQGLEFTGGRGFMSDGLILFNGELQATYVQYSIDDRANELAFNIQMHLRSPELAKRVATNVLLGAIIQHSLSGQPTPKEGYIGPPRRFRPNDGPGAMRRHEYEASPKHGATARGNIGAAPKNGQNALDASVQVKDTSPRRVGVDYQTGEIVVFGQLLHLNATRYRWSLQFQVSFSRPEETSENGLLRAG